MSSHRPSESQTRSLRLFVAFDVSPDAVDEIERAIEPWRTHVPSARWVPLANRHITVKFLGQMVPRLGDWVGERVGEAAASCAPVDTRLTGLGRFPERGRARVLWAGVDDPDGGLRAIAAALDASLAKEVRPESRPFAPHLTVARCDPAVALPEAFARTPLAAVSTRVEAITLFRSHLGRPAPRYEPLGVFPLGG